MPKLSDRLVGALTCPPGRKDALFFDGELKGFGVRVAQAGAKTFLFQYRGPNGVRRVPLGAFGSELTTAQARAKAEQLRGQVRDGRDPVADRAEVKRAAVAAQAAMKKLEMEEAFTVRRLIEVWEATHLAGLRKSYRRDAVGRLHKHLSVLMDKPAASVSRSQIVQQLDRIALDAGETTSRRVQGYARSAWSWTRRRGAIDVNPFEDLPRRGKEVQRDRVLGSDEIGNVWIAAGSLAPVHGAFARFLLLTLVRREEAASMAWSEVTAAGTQWTIPAYRSKNGKAQVVHLAPAARTLIRSLPRVTGSDLVFATSAPKGLTSFSYIARQLGQTKAADRWRLHDFRRTGVTVLASKGFAPHVCDRLLNHVQGTISGVAAIYQRHEFLEERTLALEAWAEHVIACAEEVRQAEEQEEHPHVTG